MKSRILIILVTKLLMVLFFVNLLYAQETKTVTLNKNLGYVGNSVDFYISSMSISQSNYTLFFHFITDVFYNNVRNTKIDNIYVGNYEPLSIKGITLGKMYSSPNNVKCTVIVPRKYKTLYIKGVGVSSRDFTIDLSAFDSFLSEKRNIPLESIKVDKLKPEISLSSPELSQNIYRTEEFSIIIRGKATDNEGIAFVTANDNNVSLRNDGTFQKRLKLKIGNNPIVIKAIDINDNETEYAFNIIREEFIEEEEFSDVDFAPETNIRNENGIAVVFGIEEYAYSPSVTYAYNDAEIFREYLINTFGFSRENIYFRTNERTTKGEFDKVFSKNGWITNFATDESDIFIFYAGHGAPDLKTKGTYLIPYDVDPNYAATGYSLKELYDNLRNIKSKSITIVLDACFSGRTRDNQIILADSRPVYIKIRSEPVPENAVVFCAASENEISSGYRQKLHGLFTYFFLKGLSGDADSNKDRKISVEEMHNYLKENVSAQARKMGREQTPQLLGIDIDRILLEY